MLQIENRHLEILRSILSKYPYQFYAYGSRVKGTAGKLSDLDLCYREEIPWNVFSHIREDFENSNLPFRADLVSWELMGSDFQDLIKEDLVLIEK
jgi:predicted nucleotidyltransferase